MTKGLISNNTVELLEEKRQGFTLLKIRLNRKTSDVGDPPLVNATGKRRVRRERLGIGISLGARRDPVLELRLIQYHDRIRPGLNSAQMQSCGGQLAGHVIAPGMPFGFIERGI